MTLIEDDFGSDVLRSTANGEGSSFGEELGKAKVSQLEVTIISNEQILRF